MSKAKISVVIPTHRGFKKVSATIDSLLNQTLKPYEILVIDNYSKENLHKKLKLKFKNKIKSIRLEKNSGVTGGRNAGILNVSKNSDYVFFFDHDMLADKNMLSELYKTLKKHKSGIVTPKIYYKNEKNIIWSAGTDINLTTGQVLFRAGEDIGQFDKDDEVAIAPAAMLVDKKVLKKIGGFDDRYFATYEDSDFCFRARQNGFKTFYSSSAIACHDLDKNIQQDSERLMGRAYWVARNRILFMSDFSDNFYIFMLLSPIYWFYYLLLALRTKKAAKFLSDYTQGFAKGMFEVFSNKCTKYIPFTYHWILTQKMGEPVTILDIGCGDGSLMKDLKQDSQQITGIDIFPESILLAKTSGVYKEAFVGDVNKLNSKKYKSDLVFSSQVVEHIEKKKALQSIKVWEKLAKKRVLISTTNGFVDFDPIEHKEDLNPYQEHKSGWSVSDFQKIGYNVNGQGLKFIYGENGLARKTPSWMIYFWGIISYIFAPISYYFPNHAMYLIASKKV